jgi:hypothetical protein
MDDGEQAAGEAAENVNHLKAQKEVEHEMGDT